jgi:hypothetical protein
MQRRQQRFIILNLIVWRKQRCRTAEEVPNLKTQYPTQSYIKSLYRGLWKIRACYPPFPLENLRTAFQLFLAAALNGGA